MTPTKLLKQAGFIVLASPGKPTRWGVSTEVNERTRRLRGLIQETLTAQSDRKGLLSARLVALDGVPVRALELIEKQESKPYGLEENVCLDWSREDSSRIDRRILSPLTLQIWPASSLGEQTPTALPANGLIASLEDFLAESTAYRSLSDRTVHLAMDCLCWWHEALPPSLFAHQSELTVLSALPRSSWARLQSGLVTINTDSEDATDTDVGATGELLDAALQSNGEDGSTLVLQLALDYLSEKHSTIDGVNKRMWAQQMLGLYSRALSAGPCTALLIAWVSDLCEYGTVQQKDPADTTIELYTRRALIRLHSALAPLLKDLSSLGWNPGELAMVYEALITAQSQGNRGTMRSALACFHDFLVRNLDIEPLYRPLRNEDPEPVPHAQVVWPHEIDQAIEWALWHPDAQLGQGAALIVAIANEAPVRSQELLRVRIRSVCFGRDNRGHFAEIEIARDALSGRLKTPSSQRRLTLRNPVTLERLNAWVNQRHLQGATGDAYLFGDPNRLADRYRPGATIAFVHRVLKAVTGDRLVRLHTLRHTAISGVMSEIWRSSCCIDINPIEVCAAHAGHATPITTLGTYAHAYETGIRLWLDASMAERILLNHRQVAAVTGLKPDAVRARASRSGESITRMGWWTIQSLKVSTPFETAKDAFAWGTPTAPEVQARAECEVSFDVVSAILRGRLVENVGCAGLALRHGLEVTVIEKWELDLAKYCSQRARLIHPRKLGISSDAKNSLHTAVTELGIDLRRMQQYKFRRLIEDLSQGQEQRLHEEACSSWERCHRGVHIALDDGHQALDLFRLLSASRIDGQALRLCFQSPANRPVGELQLIRQRAIDAFEAAFGIPPRSSELRCSPNRPIAYLQWDNPTSPVSESGASGGSVAGLNAVMLTLRAYLMLRQMETAK